jgi:hypothetical protein
MRFIKALLTGSVFNFRRGTHLFHRHGESTVDIPHSLEMPSNTFPKALDKTQSADLRPLEKSGGRACRKQVSRVF